jgi:hypothetical protein
MTTPTCEAGTIDDRKLELARFQLLAKAAPRLVSLNTYVPTLRMSLIVSRADRAGGLPGVYWCRNKKSRILAFPFISVTIVVSGEYRAARRTGSSQD